MDAKVQVLTESPVAHAGLQIGVGRADKPGAERYRAFASDPEECAVLNEPQQLCLQGWRQL